MSEADTEKVVQCVFGQLLAAKEGERRRTELGFPIDGMAIAYKIARRVTSCVPSSRLRTASPAVGGPILEGVRWLDEHDPLFEMFEQLLMRSCDQETHYTANPAFARLIGLLSPDEARLLFWISSRQVHRKLGRSYKTTEHMRMHMPQIGTEISCLEFPYWKFGNADAFHAGAYLDHLENLGLIGYRSQQRYISGNRDIEPQDVLLTAYGIIFTDVCIPSEGFSSFGEDAWNDDASVL
ncbi:MAG TPA: Abi-alpha family protein [Kofleriaceae bacterium]|nr:Abi-alpha family protein [Kofleriaceae bacterium]